MMAWYRCDGAGAGSGGATARLVLEAFAVDWSQDNTFPREGWHTNNYDSAYFSYSNSTYKWTALKDFDALVILINYQHRDGSAGNSYSTAEVQSTWHGGDFTSLSLNPATPDRFAGSYGVEYGYVKIKAGDTIAEGKKNQYGWEAPYFYICDMADGTAAVTTLANGANVSFTTNSVGFGLLQNYFSI